MLLWGIQECELVDLLEIFDFENFCISNI